VKASDKVQWAKNEVGVDSTQNMSKFSISGLKMANKFRLFFGHSKKTQNARKKLKLKLKT